jgi:hypothetical protein
MTLAFTLCSNNYLAQAITLGNSLIEFNQSYIFKIGLVDRKNDSINYTNIPFEVVEVESIDLDSFNDMFKRYNITELNTAVKPFYFNHFFKNEPSVDKIVFLDPDILVYRTFIELDQVLNENEIVIMPHFSTPINDDKSQAENDFLNSGLYNLGFIALKNGAESRKLLEWWAKRLDKKAYINLAKGMFTDQIWINFVPLFFKKVNIFFHPGYNIAYWNMHERLLIDSAKVIKNENEYPLVFFHFSGYTPLKPEILSKYQDRFSFENRKDVVDLFKGYSTKLFENGFNSYVQIPCYYSDEKQKMEVNAYLRFKKSIPVYKRIIRGLVLRIVKLFNINIEYYTK